MRQHVFLIALVACSDKSADPPADTPPASRAIGGTVRNLTSTGLVLALDDGSTLPITADGPFEFANHKTEGANYTVTISQQPSNQRCALQGATGTVGAAAVTTVAVTCTVGALRITELSNCYYPNVACWLELVNTSTATVDLSTYTLRASALTRANPSAIALHTFPLPAYTVPAGGRVVLRGRTDDALGSGRNLFSIVDQDYVPYWYAQGFLELVLAGTTADLVRVGTDTTAATTYGWTGGGTPTLSSMVYGGAIARDVGDHDTDAAADWQLRPFATPGGPNDITSSADTDADGIPDQAEVAGSTYAGLDLYAMGVRTNQRDILIEIDCMASTDTGTIPHKGSLDRLVAAFQPHGIVIHPDAGDLFSPVFSPAQYNLGGGNDIVPFKTLSEFDDIYGYKALHMDVRLQQISHYMMYVNSLQDAGGLAELGGNDLLVAFSTGGLNTSTPEATNRLYNFQAAGMMHELGHNLGLDHGGLESHNYKPNYLSVMNYLYVYNGVPNVGNHEGDRYALGRCGTGDEASLVNGPQTASYKLDYSDGTGGALTETALIEAAGLGRPTSVAVDFNCDQTIADSMYDIDDSGSISGTMNDHNDWASLALQFNKRSVGSSFGPADANAGEIRPVVPEHGTAVAPARH